MDEGRCKRIEKKCSDSYRRIEEAHQPKGREAKRRKEEKRREEKRRRREEKRRKVEKARENKQTTPLERKKKI